MSMERTEIGGKLRLARRKTGTGSGRGGWTGDTAREMALLLCGSLCIALSFNLFLSPNQVAAGGVSGISIIVKEWTGLEPAITQWALNIPLFLGGLLTLGGKFGVRTAVGSIVLPLMVLLTKELPPLTNNVLLASIYGGMLVGLGLGLVFRGRGSTGGLDLAAQIIHRYTGLALSGCVALLDGLVIVTAGLVISPEKALYALIGLFVTSKTINIVQLGFSQSKVAFIISRRPEQLRETILYELDRGFTTWQAAGGYTGEERKLLMVVIGQNEAARLKEWVRRVDPQAFVIISDTNEVLGEGFKMPETV